LGKVIKNNAAQKLKKTNSNVIILGVMIRQYSQDVPRVREIEETFYSHGCN
jgi:hypothetical protein